MSLFKVPPVVLVLDADPSVVITHERGYVYPLEALSVKTELHLGRQIPITGMFEIYELMLGERRVAYLFRSSFTVRNGGAYLCAFLQNKGLATEFEVLLKLGSLVVYNYPNKGTLAVSPVGSASVMKILEAQ